jgi:Arc/MetJ-type ribon-helix-helix transcriptional regulator
MDKRFSAQDEKIRSLREEMNGKFAAQDDTIRSLRDEMNEKFAAQSSEIRELKTTDSAHLYSAIEALVFSMVKNKTLTETDQQYINDRLHSTH